MKAKAILAVVAVLLAGGTAMADITIETVPLGDPGNALDSGAYFHGLGGLGSDPYINSRANGISSDGSTVVGYSQSRAFRWTATGGMQDLGSLQDTGTEAWAVSADGSVVVGSSGRRAFRWTAGRGMQDLGGVVERYEAYSVSGSGNVAVGMSFDGHTIYEAFRWTAATGIVNLGGLPGGAFSRWAWAVSADGTVIIGTGNSATGHEGVRWTTGGGIQSLANLSGGSFEGAFCVSDDGSVIAGIGTSSQGLAGIRWSEDTGVVGLGNLPDGIGRCAPTAMSADGSVIVGESYTSLGTKAFIWDSANGMRSLQDVLEHDCGITTTGWSLTSASGVSADGRTIVGYGQDPSGYTEAWVATIPEPASLSLLALGGLAVMRRGRK